MSFVTQKRMQQLDEEYVNGNEPLVDAFNCLLSARGALILKIETSSFCPDPWFDWDRELCRLMTKMKPSVYRYLDRSEKAKSRHEA